VIQAARMIGVEVRQHDVPDVARVDAEAAELGPSSSSGWTESRRASVERMPARVIAALVHASGFAGIDDDDALLVLDGPGIDRQPLGPVVVKQHVREAGGTAAARGHLGPPDLDQTGTECMDFRCHERAIRVRSASSASASARVDCLNWPK
jgi:hypothetical protein